MSKELKIFSTYRYIIAILSRDIILPLCLGPPPAFVFLHILDNHIFSHLFPPSQFLRIREEVSNNFPMMRLRSHCKGLCAYPSIFKRKYIENIYCLHFRVTRTTDFHIDFTPVKRSIEVEGKEAKY